MPSILAVTFLGLIDGKNVCRPATDDEQRRPEADHFFGELLCREPTTAPPPGRIWVRNLRTGFYGTIPMADVAVATEGPNAEYTLYEPPLPWHSKKRGLRTKRLRKSKSTSIVAQN